MDIAVRADAVTARMDLKKKISISWSGGKDSALTLYHILRSEEFEVVSLHTLFDEEARQVGMHGIPEDLIEDQAKSLAIPLIKIYLKKGENNQAYQKLLYDFYQSLAAEGVTHVAFGDLFLEDLKIYREKLLLPTGLSPIFPLWQQDTRELLGVFIEKGFRSILCSVNKTCFQAGLLGKTIDADFLTVLPEGIDPCGENGEYHTFVFDGPDFKQPIPYTLGEEISKQYDYQVTDENGNTRNCEAWFYFRITEKRRTTAD